MIRRLLASTLLATVLGATTSSTARADAPAMFGFGAEAASLARAGLVAGGQPADAPRENAALAATPGLRVRLGYGYAALGLTFDGKDQGLERASGVDLAAQYGVLVGRGVSVGLALALHLPDQYIARVSFRPATEPQFVLYEGSLQRTTFDLVAAIHYRGLAIGGGAAVGLGVGGDGTRFSLAQDAGGARADGGVNVALPYQVAPLVGARADFGRVAVGASFRGAMPMSLSLDSFATVALQDNPLNGTTTVRVRGVTGYDPAVIAAGARVFLIPGLAALASLEYAVYRATPPPVADVTLDVHLGTTPGQREARFVEPRFRDTLSPRAGLELRLPADDTAGWSPNWRWAARVGYALAPSPVPRQTGFTTYLDAARHAIALGGGVHLGRLAGADLTLAAATQLHLLAPRSESKPNPSLPYAHYEAGGHIVTGAISLEAAW